MEGPRLVECVCILGELQNLPWVPQAPLREVLKAVLLRFGNDDYVCQRVSELIKEKAGEEEEEGEKPITDQ